jgi:tetratricopeptide (TPR) repeat protein
MIKKCILLLFVTFSLLMQAQAQDNYNLFLARQFAEEGELLKAIEYYEKISYTMDGMAEVYEEYLKVLIQAGDAAAEEKLINKAWQMMGKDPMYLVDLALMYKRRGDEDNAKKSFARMVDGVKQNAFQINAIARKLIAESEYEQAIAVYMKGKQAFKNPALFNLELAYIAGLKGDREQMISAFVQELQASPNAYYEVVTSLQRVIEDEKNAAILERELYRAIGKDKENRSVRELLTWLYMQQKDYESAFEQARSLDLMNGEDGNRVVQLARAAVGQRDYETAIKAFQYVVDKGPSYEYFVTASLELINTRKDRLVQTLRYTQDDLWALRKAYLDFLSAYQNIYTSTSAAIDLADLEARYLYRLDTAISILQGFVEKPGIHRDLQAKAKLALGDYFIMNGEPWESLLLYTQVEKDFKGTPTGEEAKYRNARLSYFKGDFEWALTQLKIIKANTSELISNDAIALSVFISDHFNQDQEEDKAAMNAFAQMDLLFFQNRLPEAKSAAEAHLKKYPGHALEDDVFYKLSRIARKEQDYEQALHWLKRIANEYAFDILGDDATFEVAELYERYLQQPEQAREWYEKIILEFKDSTFVVEARKRYRQLRGDEL